jgi:glycosyltransferase involved in cell wall biosynthesis
LHTALNPQSFTLCWIINAPYDSIGGAANRFRTEVEHFSRYNFPVQVICRQSRHRPPTKTSLLRWRTSLFPFFFAELFLKATWVIFRRGRVNFIIHDPVSAIPVSLAARLLKNRSKALLVVHGPMYLEQRWLTGLHRKRVALLPALFIFERLAYALAHTIFAVSEYEVSYLNEIGFERKVRMIRNGIPIERFSTLKSSSFRKELGVNADEFLIVNVGHLYPYRGLSHLLRAAAIASATAPAVLRPRLAIVGRGSASNSYEFDQETEVLGIKDIVKFVGDREDIPNVLRAGDVYAERFSRKVNGIGIAIMEAMAAGVPVVTGSDWITTQLLHHGHDCLLVQKEDSAAIAEAFLLLGKDSSLRKRIGRNGQETARKLFSVETMLKNCEKEYLQSSFQDPMTQNATIGMERS